MGNNFKIQMPHIYYKTYIYKNFVKLGQIIKNK
nr:MAG TPA: hypothetical protein [Caudoviricetes sp.]